MVLVMVVVASAFFVADDGSGSDDEETTETPVKKATKVNGIKGEPKEDELGFDGDDLFQ